MNPLCSPKAKSKLNTAIQYFNRKINMKTRKKNNPRIRTLSLRPDVTLYDDFDILIKEHGHGTISKAMNNLLLAEAKRLKEKA